MARNKCDLEQDVMRACIGCAGAVAHVDGKIGCALEPPFPCVLIEVLKAAGEDFSLLDSATSEWVGANAHTTGPADFNKKARK